VTQIISEQSEQHEQIALLAKQFSAEDIQLYYQIALIGRKDLSFAPHQQQAFEMILLRMLAFKPAQEDFAVAAPISKKIAEKPEKIAPITTPAPKVSNEWETILAKLGLSGMAYALASNCTLVEIQESRIELALSPQHQPMLNPKLSERIEQALNTYFNSTRKLEIKITTNTIHTPAKQKELHQAEKQIAATEAIKNDTHIKNMLDIFDATLDVNSIKSID
jgi:DNA polymerase-3 subunit gamma/tau